MEDDGYAGIYQNSEGASGQLFQGIKGELQDMSYQRNNKEQPQLWYGRI